MVRTGGGGSGWARKLLSLIIGPNELSVVSRTGALISLVPPSLAVGSKVSIAWARAQLHKMHENKSN